MNTNNKPANYSVINYLAALQCGPLDQRTENNRSYYASANNCALDLSKSMKAARLAFGRAAKKKKKKDKKKKKNVRTSGSSERSNLAAVRSLWFVDQPNRIKVSDNICTYSISGVEDPFFLQ